jgi:MtrB/PioB family decaheme-associated outer membrane protein
MNTREQTFGFQQKLLVLALLAAFGPAHAAEDDLAKLIKPDTTVVSVGAAVVAGDRKERSLFGQYNGWAKDDSGLLLDFVVIKRDDETGTWLNAEGRNLGQDNRELSFSRQKQGSWKYSVEYSEQVRHDPRTLNTGLAGIGSTVLTVNSLAAKGTGANQNLDITRKGYTLAGEDWVTSNLLLDFSFKSEDKDGARLTGVGAYCSPSIPGATCSALSGALLMLAEPINSTTTQLEAKAHLIGSDYSLTAGYYVSAYQSDNGSVRVGSINGNLFDSAGASFSAGSGANTLGALLTQPVALAPDNQAYQYYLSGNFRIAPKVQTTFSYTETHAKQNESFAGMGLAAAAGLPGSLNGAVDTALTQVGITARPFPKLSLLANVRFEDVKDSTPHALYGGTYSNATYNSQKANSKAEASYVFPENFRGTLGYDFNWNKRNVPGVGSTEQTISPGSLTSVRENTSEQVYRIELRKPFTDTLNASIAYSKSMRDGSHWINLGSTSAVYPLTYQPVRWADAYNVTGVFPTTMIDRQRDKVRVMMDWVATDKLSLQFSLENGEDNYSAPTTKGLHGTSMSAYGVDASYVVSDTWKATGFINYNQQGDNVDHSGGYIARIDNTSTNIGVGVVGKVSGNIEVGADLSYLDDRNHYGLASGSSAAAGSLPDVNYRMLALKLSGKYALDKNSDVRVDLINQNTTFDEWTWGNAGVPFAYSDNSTVSMQSNQNVTYLGVKYVYRIK